MYHWNPTDTEWGLLTQHEKNLYFEAIRRGDHYEQGRLKGKILHRMQEREEGSAEPDKDSALV